jgi:hypothetical protein
MLITLFVNFANGQDANTPPGIQKMQALSGLVGTWRGDDGNVATYRWINNDSYIEMIAGDYREITGWDLTEKKIVSWGFGTHGGQGKHIWEQQDQNTWTRTCKWLDRWGKEFTLESKVVVNDDEMSWNMKYGENELDPINAKRVAP